MDIKIDITETVLETERLILRAWCKEDLDNMYEYASVEGVGEMAGWRHHESIAVSEAIIDSFISDKNVFAIVYKENSKAVGSLGIHESWANEDKNYLHLKVKEIGYVLSKDYWGKGLATEAARAVISFCFEELGLEALTCGHFVSNSRSKRVIEKCGFAFASQTKRYVRQLDQTLEDINYILLR